MKNIVEFKSVSKSYNQNTVLEKLSFEVREHDFVALIGNNGCGKTTTISILCNLINYDSGEVIAFEKVVTQDYVSYKNKLGIVLSKPYFIDELTPAEFLQFVGEFQNVPKALIKTRINDVLSFLNLQSEKKSIEQLSSGSQIKVSLAAALLHNPEMLILDEPFVNLDISTIEKVMGVLKSLKGKKTIFITSHNLDLVGDLCERFLIMDKGKIILELSKNDFNNMEDFKDKIKSSLSVIEDTINLDWLS
jgi:ABC-2 type transport system ATP-binding protein